MRKKARNEPSATQAKEDSAVISVPPKMRGDVATWWPSKAMAKGSNVIAMAGEMKIIVSTGCDRPAD